MKFEISKENINLILILNYALRKEAGSWAREVSWSHENNYSTFTY